MQVKKLDVYLKLFQWGQTESFDQLCDSSANYFFQESGYFLPWKAPLQCIKALLLTVCWKSIRHINVFNSTWVLDSRSRMRFNLVTVISFFFMKCELLLYLFVHSSSSIQHLLHALIVQFQKLYFWKPCMVHFCRWDTCNSWK